MFIICWMDFDYTMIIFWIYVDDMLLMCWRHVEYMLIIGSLYVEKTDRSEASGHEWPWQRQCLAAMRSRKKDEWSCWNTWWRLWARLQPDHCYWPSKKPSYCICVRQLGYWEGTALMCIPVSGLGALENPYKPYKYHACVCMLYIYIYIYIYT